MPSSAPVSMTRYEFLTLIIAVIVCVFTVLHSNDDLVSPQPFFRNF